MKLIHLFCVYVNNKGGSQNKQKAYVYSTSCWLLYVPGCICIAYTHYFRGSNPILAIWIWDAIVELMRTLFTFYFVFHTNWKQVCKDAKLRNEACHNNNKDNENTMKQNNDNDSIIVLNDSISNLKDSLLSQQTKDDSENEEETTVEESEFVAVYPKNENEISINKKKYKNQTKHQSLQTFLTDNTSNLTEVELSNK